MSDFITDVERQYEMYCKIAEEHGFIDLNAKKNGFRCTTKSNEFNAGWIAFVGAVAAVRDEQQAQINELQKRIDGALFEMQQLSLMLSKDIDGYEDPAQICQSEGVDMGVRILEKALRGAND